MRIGSHAPWTWVGMAAASVPTLGLTGTYLYLMQQEGRDRWFVYLVMAPFLLVGVLLAFFGFRALLDRTGSGVQWQLNVIVPIAGVVQGAGFRPPGQVLARTGNRSGRTVSLTRRRFALRLSCADECLVTHANVRASASAPEYARDGAR